MSRPKPTVLLEAVNKNTYKAEQIGYHSQVVTAGRRINDGMANWIVENFVRSLFRSGLNIQNSKVLILSIDFWKTFLISFLFLDLYESPKCAKKPKKEIFWLVLQKLIIDFIFCFSSIFNPARLYPTSIFRYTSIESCNWLFNIFRGEIESIKRISKILNKLEVTGANLDILKNIETRKNK